MAVASGVLAGPLTPLEVATATPQETGRWLTRAGFFVVIGVGMAALVRPSLPSIVDEIRRQHPEQQRDALAELGYDLAQGYLYAHPMMAAEVDHLLAASAEVGKAPRLPQHHPAHR